MQVSNLEQSIKHNEGFRSSVYKDHLGNPTIGYGFLVSSLTKDELELNGGVLSPMTEQNANAILQLKLAKLTSSCVGAFPFLVHAPACVRDVVMEMAYQIGIDGVRKFKNTLALIEDGDYKNASKEMLNSLWAKQTPRRAKSLSVRIKNA